MHFETLFDYFSNSFNLIIVEAGKRFFPSIEGCEPPNGLEVKISTNCDLTGTNTEKHDLPKLTDILSTRICSRVSKDLEEVGLLKIAGIRDIRTLLGRSPFEPKNTVLGFFLSGKDDGSCLCFLR